MNRESTAPAITQRAAAAEEIARRAGQKALEYYQSVGLQQQKKGLQDFVSEADRAVENLIRDAIAADFPDDALLGEEFGVTPGSSGYTWVFDPIDGTANFLSGIATWAVSIAIVFGDSVVVGVTHDPLADETFSALRGGGAFLNGQRLPSLGARRIDEGTIGVGFSFRVAVEPFTAFLTALLKEGGMFYRNASGALMLAQVAAGRLIGYYEPHMNCWDCLAGLLLIEEAGGDVLDYDMTTMLRDGAPVLGAGPGCFDQIRALTVTPARMA